MEISPNELIKIQAYLRSQTNDSIEVLINGEFIGLVYKDEDEGETSYDFNMSILDFDLPE